MMELSSRLPTILMIAMGLTACAMESREGPPAPVVQVTPPLSAPATVPGPEPVRPAVPAAKPAAPSKPKTTLYAYRDPGAPPEPEPAPPAPAIGTAPVKPAEINVAQDSTAPKAESRSAQSKPAAPAKPATPPVAKVEPKPREPAKPASKPKPEPIKPVVPAKPAAPTVAKAEPKPPVAPDTTTPRAEAPPPERQVTSAPAAAPPISAPSLPPAAQALASQAEQQRQSGDYAGAAASLERSLRIAPREAYLWNRLARVRMEQGQGAQAGNLAARSNDLAGKDATVKKDNWRIIAESKRRAGDTVAAAEAERRAGAD